NRRRGRRGWGGRRDYHDGRRHHRWWWQGWRLGCHGRPERHDAPTTAEGHHVIAVDRSWLTIPGEINGDNMVAFGGGWRVVPFGAPVAAEPPPLPPPPVVPPTVVVIPPTTPPAPPPPPV